MAEVAQVDEEAEVADVGWVGRTGSATRGGYMYIYIYTYIYI